MTNGVKQRAIVSPMLFTCYIDILLLELKHSSIDCHIDNYSMSAWAHADDITLLHVQLFSIII